MVDRCRPFRGGQHDGTVIRCHTIPDHRGFARRDCAVGSGAEFVRQADSGYDVPNRMNRSAADRAYRRSALPFALVLLAGGITFCVAAFATPAHAIFLPPFESEMTKRAVVFAIGLCVFVTGAGFLWRRVWALYAFVGYVLLGTAWHVVAALTDPASRWLLVSPLINLPIGFGVYWLTRAAFFRDAQHPTTVAPSVRQKPNSGTPSV